MEEDSMELLSVSAVILNFYPHFPEDVITTAIVPNFLPWINYHFIYSRV